MLTGLAIGFYDGALGPGTGSFFVFTLVGLLGYSFLEASAKAKLANWATNLGALLVFVPQGAVHVEGRPADGWLPTCSAATSARGRRSRAASRFVRIFFIVVVSAFIVRIGGTGARPVVSRYLTIARDGEAEIEVKRSRFRCTLVRVEDEAAARAVVERLRRQHWDARHHCSAFVLGPERDVERSSDDGEPAGTAGAPMLEVLRGHEGVGVSDVVGGGEPVVRRHAAGGRRAGPGLRRRGARRARDDGHPALGSCWSSWRWTSGTPTPVGWRASCAAARSACWTRRTPRR